MKRLMFALAMTVASTTPLVAAQKSHGHADKSAKHGQQASDLGAKTVVAVRFSTGDTRVLHEYYTPRYKSLPPGLQKKVARGGTLPPGWQKKLQPFPVEVERRLEPLPSGYARGVFDGHAVIYNTRSHAVIDVTVLF